MICLNARNESVQQLFDKQGERVVRAMAMAVATDSIVYIKHNGKLVESDLYKKIRSTSKDANEAWDKYLSTYSKEFKPASVDKYGEAVLESTSDEENKFISNGETNILAKIGNLRAQFPAFEIKIGDENKRTKLEVVNDTTQLTINETVIGVPFAYHEHAIIQIAGIGGINGQLAQNGVSVLKNSKFYKDILASWEEGSENTAAFQEYVLSEALATTENLWSVDQAKFKMQWSSWRASFNARATRVFSLPASTLTTKAQSYLDNVISGERVPKPASINYREVEGEVTSQDIAQQSLLNAIKVLKDKINFYANQIDEGALPKRQAELRNLINQLADTEPTAQMLSYLEYASNYASSQKYKLEVTVRSNPEYVDSSTFSDDYENYKSFLGFTSHLNDLANIVSANPELEAYFAHHKLTHKLSKALGDRVYVENRLKSLAKQRAFNVVVPLYKQHIRAYEEEKLAEYKKDNPINKGESQEKYREKADKWVQEQVDANPKTLEAMGRTEVARILEVMPFDMAAYESIWVDPRSAANPIIGIMMEVFDRANVDKQQAVDALLPATEKAYNDFWKHVEGRKTMTEKYDEMIENKIKIDKDGNPVFKNGKAVLEKGKVGGFTNQYYLTQYNRVRKGLEEDLQIAKDGLDPKVDEVEAKVNKWYAENSVPGTDGLVPNTKWDNPQFTQMEKLRAKDSPIARAYDFLVDVQERADDHISYDSLLLGNGLPMIEKGFFERKELFGTQAAVKTWYNELTRVTADDQDYGQLTPAEIANPKLIKADRFKLTKIKRVPLHYRRAVADEDVSHDLFTSTMLNYSNSLNYAYLRDTQSTAEFLKDTLEQGQVRVGLGVETEYQQGDELNPAFDVIEKDGRKVTMRYETAKASESEFYKAYSALVDSNLYGIRNKSSVLMTKVTANAKTLFSNITLNSNFSSAARNLAQGTIQNLIETTGGGLLNKQNIINGNKKYFGNMGANIARGLGDIGRRVPKTKTNSLIRKFNAMADWQTLNRDYDESSFFRKHFKGHYLSYATTAGEHAIQSKLLYALLDSKKVKAPNGEMVSLDEAYNEDGTTKEGFDIDPDLEFKVTQQINDLVRKLHINLDPRNRGTIALHWQGRMAMVFRNWIPGGVKRRWRGIGRPADNKYYNMATEQFEEGIYTTTFRFLKGFTKDIKRFQYNFHTELLRDWNKLTDTDRAAVRKTIMEAAGFVIMLSVANMARAKWKDEDDPAKKKVLAHIAYLTKSLSMELSFYVWPPDTVQILRNPTVMLKMLESTINLLDAASPWNWGETYTTGRNAGQSKLTKAIGDLTPVYKGLIGRDIDLMNQYVFKE